MTITLKSVLAAVATLPLLANTTGAQELVVGAAGNVGGMAVFVAQEKGFFAANDVDVKVEIRNTGSELSKGLRAGTFDFAPAAFTNLPAALERGLDVRGIVGYVGGSFTKPTTDSMVGMVAGPNSGIEKLADLRGKKIGVTFGSTGDAYFQAMLAQAGLTINDVDRVNTRPPSLTSVLDTSGVDAIVGWEPFVYRTIEKVQGSRLIKRGGDLVCFCALLHGSPDSVYKDEAKTQKLVDAMAQAHAYVRDEANRDEVAEIGARFANMTKEEVLNTIGYWTYDPRIGANTSVAFKASVEQLIAQKKMKRPYDPAKYLEPKFIESTMNRHPEWFADLSGS